MQKRASWHEATAWGSGFRAAEGATTRDFRKGETHRTVRKRLEKIKSDPALLRARLTTTHADLEAGATAIRSFLRLMTDPQGLYLRASDPIRRLLNEAIFRRIYVVNDKSATAS